jgi:hypothetical protein
MIHTTQLTHNRATYSDVYLFLKLYLNGLGTAEAEAVIYGDQEMKDQIGAMRLPNYTFDQLGDYPMMYLHTVTIAQLQAENPTAVVTECNPLITESTDSE